MRWTAAMVMAVACGGLLACGSDGDLEARSPGADGGGGTAVEPADDPFVDAAEADGGDPGEGNDCPSAAQVGDVVGQELSVFDGRTDDEDVIGCFYQSLDSDLLLDIFCETYPSVGDAEEEMSLHEFASGLRYTAAGDEGVLVDMGFVAQDGRNLVGFRAYARTGNTICDGSYTTYDLPTREPPAEYDAALALLMTATSDTVRSG